MLDEPDFQQIAALGGLAWLEKLNDAEELRKMKLSFAKVGVFNPLTQLDEMEQLRRWSKGDLGKLRDYFTIQQWTPNDPVVLKHVKMRLLNSKGHRRKNRMFYKAFEVEDTIAPIQLIPHALLRFRQRSGRFISSDMMWDDPVPQPPSITGQVDVNTKIMRKDLMQPTVDGAWLGYPLMCGETHCVSTYSRKRGFDQNWSSKPTEGFRAFTWVSYNQMLPYQRNAWNAYQNKDFDKAVQIMTDNVNQNQTAEKSAQFVIMN
jgi:hypothetical protein